MPRVGCRVWDAACGMPRAHSLCQGMEITAVHVSADDIAPHEAVAAGHSFEERVRRREVITETEAIKSCRRISDDHAPLTQPAGCYACAPVSMCNGMCNTWLGGVLWLSCSKGCAFTPLQCLLGIPLTPLPMDFCMASSVQNAKESKYGWSFNFGTLYAVDVERDTFACFRNRLGTDQNTVCCYCMPVVGCGSRCRGEDAW
jgi:hypothetical protein